MNPIQITFTFDNPESRDHFLAWFLDGGGMDSWYQIEEIKELPSHDFTQKTEGKWIDIEVKAVTD